MNYKSFNLGDWIGHISGVIEDETTLDGNEMGDLVEFLSTLKQEPCEDEIILTKEEYGQLLSNEFDNGYAKGYREALEQDSILDKIRADVEDLDVFYDNDYFSSNNDAMFKCNDVLQIIDTYKAESEEEE